MNARLPDLNMNIAERVLQAAGKYPDRIALELPGSKHTYRELTETAGRIARSITELNDKSPFVAVVADKSFSCFAGILGILMAGKAYMPVNPRFPDSRNLYMMEKARIGVIIIGETYHEQLELMLDSYPGRIFVIFPECVAPSNLTHEVIFTGNPSYLLFTSGTTGKPKGVPVSHRNVSGYLDFMQKTYDFRPEDRFTQNFDLTFDLSVHDIFLAWTSGACLCVPEDNSSFAMKGFILEKQPTVWFSVPSVVMLMERMRLLKNGIFPSIRLSFFCGEALNVRTVLAWKTAAAHSRLVNLYGPTEATIAVSGYELPEEPAHWKSAMGIISIGRIFEGNSYMTSQETSQVGEGELFLSGRQVVTGYFENEAADRDAFFTEPGSDLKWYKTGDLVKVDEDGDLFFLGRSDDEVKISGYRVNMKEIENVLLGYDSALQAVVIYEQAEDSTGMIMAFVQKPAKTELNENELFEYMRKHLPWYMVPGKLIFVDEMPLNPNGKVDAGALKKKYANEK